MRWLVAGLAVTLREPEEPPPAARLVDRRGRRLRRRGRRVRRRAVDRRGLPARDGERRLAGHRARAALRQRHRDVERARRSSRRASSRTRRVWRAGPDGPIASAELFVVVDVPKRATGTDANVPLRGVEPPAFAVRPRGRDRRGPPLPRGSERGHRRQRGGARVRRPRGRQPHALGRERLGGGRASSPPRARSTSPRSGPTRASCSPPTGAAPTSSRSTSRLEIAGRVRQRFKDALDVRPAARGRRDARGRLLRRAVAGAARRWCRSLGNTDRGC